MSRAAAVSCRRRGRPHLPGPGARGTLACGALVHGALVFGAIALGAIACGADPCADASLPALRAACTGDCHCALPEPAGFDGHTRDRFDSREALLAYGLEDHGRVAMKFVLEGFDGPHCRRHFLDPRFYVLHDQWMSFRRMNGVDVAGCDEPVPADVGRYATMAEIAAAISKDNAAANQLTLLKDGRLLDCAFYERVIGTCFVSAPAPPPRPLRLGGGTLTIHAPDPDRLVEGEIWAFSIYAWAIVDAATVERLYARLVEGLPASERPKLRWHAIGDGWQRSVALALRAGGGPLAERVILDEELGARDAGEGYTVGVAAGVPRFVGAGEGEVAATTLGPDDIALFAETPDEIGPVAAIVTRTRQTPQAHLNLLAAARGTPNAASAALLADPELRARAAAGLPIALKVETDRVRWRPLDDPQLWQRWLDAHQPGVGEVAVAALEGAPAAVALDGLRIDEASAQIGLLGGKCVGIHALVDAVAASHIPWIEAVPTPLCVTVKACAETLAQALTALDVDASAALAHPAMADALNRVLALEGPAAFALAHAAAGGDDPQGAIAARLAAIGGDSDLGRLISAGGMMSVVAAAQPLPATLAAIDAAVEARFGALDRAQALRLRSSSTVEDTDAFNGAGLYTSETAYRAPVPKGKRSVDAALALVFASYWRRAAFDERARAGIDHLDGRMAVLVHPRFDDDAELANGVILAHVRRSPAGSRSLTLTINTQLGAVSVTNPTVGAVLAPEIARVLAVGGTVKVQRVSPSPLSPAAPILSDAFAELLWHQLDDVADAWLAGVDALLPALERPFGVTLDLEFKVMAPSWPRRLDGAPGRRDDHKRVVLKQLRTLARRPRLALGGYGFAVPADLAAAAIVVDEARCAGPGFVARAVRVFLDADDATFGGEPPVLIGLEVAPAPALGPVPLAAATTWTLDHLALRAGGAAIGPAADGSAAAAHRAVDAFGPVPADQQQADGLRVDGIGRWRIQRADVTSQGIGATCVVVHLDEAVEVSLGALF